VWSIKRTASYGSDHLDERPLEVSSARLSADGLSVFLRIPKLRPTRCMEITYQIKGIQGQPVNGVIHNTIHGLSAEAVSTTHAPAPESSVPSNR
jgi:hypothetical protein